MRRTLLCLLISLSLAAPALSQEAGVAGDAPAVELDDDAKKQRAREAYEAGRTHYTVGEFDQALARFSEAYKLRPAPLLLFNMGQCERQLKNHDRAVFFLEGYLRDAPPDDANREIAAELLVEEKQLADKQKADEVAAAAAARAAEEAAAAEAEAAQAAAVQEVAPPPAEEETAREEPPIWTQWWLWTGIAAGVVVATAAVGTTAAVIALSDDGVPDSSLGTVDLR